MELSDKLTQVLYSFISQIPSFITILVCLILCVVRWKRHPKVSLVLVIALVLLLAHIVIFAFVYPFVPSLITTPSDYKTRETVFLVISFMYNLMLAVILGVILLGIFMQRPAVSEPVS
jgi:hypothetical protein